MREIKTAYDEYDEEKDRHTQKMTNDNKSKEAPGDLGHFSKGRGVTFLVTTSPLAPPCTSSLQTLVLDNHPLALQDSFNNTTSAPHFPKATSGVGEGHLNVCSILDFMSGYHMLVLSPSKAVKLLFFGSFLFFSFSFGGSGDW